MVVIDYYLTSESPRLPLNARSGVFKVRSGPIRMGADQLLSRTPERSKSGALVKRNSENSDAHHPRVPIVVRTNEPKSPTVSWQRVPIKRKSMTAMMTVKKTAKFPQWARRSPPGTAFDGQ